MHLYIVLSFTLFLAFNSPHTLNLHYPKISAFTLLASRSLLQNRCDRTPHSIRCGFNSPTYSVTGISPSNHWSHSLGKIADYRPESSTSRTLRRLSKRLALVSKPAWRGGSRRAGTQNRDSRAPVLKRKKSPSIRANHGRDSWRLFTASCFGCGSPAFLARTPAKRREIRISATPCPYH